MLVDHDNAHRKHIEKIEKQGKNDNWGEGIEQHIIKMAPLVPFGGLHHSPAMHLSGFGQAMSELVKSITKPGKAPEHKKGPILPKNVLKPGAHPSSKKEEKHGKEHHKDHKSEVKKEESKSQELKKPTKIN